MTGHTSEAPAFGLHVASDLVEAIAHRIAAIVVAEIGTTTTSTTPYMTVVEAAEYMRCSRQRVDDLLSAGRLKRHKEGRRTLLERVEVESWVRVDR